VTAARSRVHALVPLALLEAIRALDLPTEDGLEEFHPELTLKRLGMNRTVAAGIERYRSLAGSGRKVVEAGEVAALVRLVERRRDAALVYSEAGRRAARLAAQRVPALLVWLARRLPWGGQSLGWLVARRLAGLLGVRLERRGFEFEARLEPVAAAALAEGGTGCSLFGSAAAELLRLFTSFDGALLHRSCRARGEAHCEWRADAPAED
jgi:hypothetical protein